MPKTPSKAAHLLSIGNDLKKNVNRNYKDLSQQVAQYRFASQSAPVFAAATGLPGQNYPVNIQGNTEFEQSANYLDRIFGESAAKSQSFL